MESNKYYYEEQNTINNWMNYINKTHERINEMWNCIQYNQFINEEVRRLQRQVYYMKRDLSVNKDIISSLRNQLECESKEKDKLISRINIKLKESKKRKRNDSEDWIISEKRRKPSDYDMLTLKDREKLLKRTFENLESLEDIISFSSNSNRFDMLNNSKFEKLYKLIPSCKKLNSMIGFDKVKKDIFKQISYFLHGLNNSNEINHVVITGEPGVGKTTLAKIIAEIYLAMGFLKNNIIREAKRSDLIGEYCGQTAVKTQKVINSIEGGVLFIDEVYSLGNRERRDVFTKECIDTINQNLTEKGDKFLCIIAGYKNEVQECFFNYNKGLERRFPVRFELESYDDEQMVSIFYKFISEDNWLLDFNVSRDNILKIFNKNKDLLKYQAGDIRTLFQYTKEKYSMRLFKESIEIGVGSKIIKYEDIEYAFNKFKDIRSVKPIIPEFLKNMYI